MSRAKITFTQNCCSLP